ncbi:hypothetical protein [Streptomyces sp. A13(2022)]|uniref:hypothetical protein n=1 Tax=Streptomyces sp. A13(2022) TaxID=2964768 RepID=UPI0021D8D374|nr:hypothetical protein [Streptomyces sp. A13(2022)]MCU8591777.1 hypothetical protein [Streptomyces sp. A13(2022)]
MPRGWAFGYGQGGRGVQQARGRGRRGGFAQEGRVGQQGGHSVVGGFARQFVGAAQRADQVGAVQGGE